MLSSTPLIKKNHLVPITNVFIHLLVFHSVKTKPFFLPIKFSLEKGGSVTERVKWWTTHRFQVPPFLLDGFTHGSPKSKSRPHL